MSKGIPNNWRRRKLGEIASVVSGGTPARDNLLFWGEEVPWVTPTDITNTRGRFLFDTSESLSSLGLAASSASLLPSGAILMTSRATVGEARIAAREVCTNQGFKSLVPKKGIDNIFLFYQMQRSREAYQLYGIGSTFLEVSKKNTERFELLVPNDLLEQQKISQILSTTDDAIAHTEALIQKYQQIKAGLMHDLFTRGITADGKLRPPREEAPELYKETAIGWIPKEWITHRASHFISSFDAGKSPECPDKPAGDDQWGVLKVSAVSPTGLRQLENKVVEKKEFHNPTLLVKQDDLLISRANTPELVGMICHVSKVRKKLLLSDKTLRLQIDQSVINKRYLYWAFQYGETRKQIEINATGSSGSMKNISQQDIRDIRINLPQDIQEQDRIRQRLDGAFEKLVYEQKVLRKLIKMKSGLMHDLLTGKKLVPNSI